MMFMASNQFRVVKGQEEAFENILTARHSRLHETPGFIGFRFNKGKESENHVLYMWLTTWETEECFLAWRCSEQFRHGHENTGKTGRRYLRPSGLENFEALFDKTNPQ